MVEGKRYEVILTKPAQINYQKCILKFIDQRFILKRQIEIQKALAVTLNSLNFMPMRGSNQFSISNSLRKYKFLLFKETRHFQIKIIYYVDEKKQTVYVTDFFPTMMNPKRIGK